eukprot:g58559.t1
MTNKHWNVHFEFRCRRCNEEIAASTADTHSGSEDIGCVCEAGSVDDGHWNPSDPSIDSDDDRFYAFLYNEGCTEDVQRVFVKKYKSYLEGDKLAKTVVNQPP